MERIEPPSIEERIDTVAHETGFDRQILYNVVYSETGGTFDCSRVGKAGELGCLQIIPEFHPNVDPLNFEEAARYFISEYRAGRGWQWTSCSCTASARLTVKNLPRGDAKDLKPNATLQTGKIAILRYGERYHVFAYKIDSRGLFAPLEGNFKPCLIAERLIPWEEMNEHLVGFWSPGSN